MRIPTAFILASGLPEIARAHSLPGDESPLLQLAHEVFSLHHLPALLLLLAVGLLCYRYSKRVQRAGAKS